MFGRISQSLANFVVIARLGKQPRLNINAKGIERFQGNRRLHVQGHALTFPTR